MANGPVDQGSSQLQKFGNYWVKTSKRILPRRLGTNEGIAVAEWHVPQASPHQQSGHRILD